MNAALQNLWSSWRRELSALTQWWLGQQREFWAQVYAILAPRRSLCAILRFDAGRLRVRVTRGGHSSETVDFCQDEAGQWPDRPFRDEPDELRGMRAVVLIGESSVLRHELTFPRMPAHSLAGAVKLALERELPMPSDTLSTSWFVRGKDADRGATKIGVIAARKDLVDGLVRLVEQWGLKPARVALAAEESEDLGYAGALGNLLSTATLPIVMPAFSTRDRWLLATLAGVLMLGAAVEIGKSVRERMVASTYLEHARIATEAFTSLQRRVDSQLAPVRALTALESRGDSLTRLTALTSHLSTAHWASHISLQEKADGQLDVEMTAETPDSNVLLDELSGTPGVISLKRVSSVSAGVGTGKERVVVQAGMGGA